MMKLLQHNIEFQIRIIDYLFRYPANKQTNTPTLRRVLHSLVAKQN